MCSEFAISSGLVALTGPPLRSGGRDFGHGQRLGAVAGVYVAVMRGVFLNARCLRDVFDSGRHDRVASLASGRHDRVAPFGFGRHDSVGVFSDSLLFDFHNLIY
jgi:hypothetical protein